MNRGFALIMVLWLMAALSALALTGREVLYLGRPKVENRLHTTRALWAARACMQIFRARFADDPSITGLDSVSLGTNVWCAARVDRPASRLDVNRTDERTLARFFGDDSIAAAVTDWRDVDQEPSPGGAERSWYATRDRRTPRDGPIARVEELGAVKGITPEALARLGSMLETEGDGTINPNHAPLTVLAALSEIPEQGGAELVRLREHGRAFQSTRDVVEALSALGMPLGLDRARALARRLSFRPQPEAVVVEGMVRGARQVLRVGLLVSVTPRADGRTLAIRSEKLR